VSKIVRIVGISGSCIVSPGAVAESSVHWNIQGAPGVNGTNGTNGTSVTITGALRPGDTRCPAGGVSLTDGTGTPYYLCNGVDGTSVTRADGPCFDDVNRYVDCGNGTVTDTVTGLVWLKHWDCLGSMSWAAANQAAAGLKNGDCGLNDKSTPSDWRLPTQAEWSATMAAAIGLGCYFRSGQPFADEPSLTDDAGTACYSNGVSSFPTIYPIARIWSSSTVEGNPQSAYVAWFMFGDDSESSPKAIQVRVWPVRGGSR
jgi:hypothetical protein